MVRNIIKAIAILMLIAGVALLAYPHVSQWLYDRESDDLVQGFDKQIEQLKNKEESPSAAGADANPGLNPDANLNAIPAFLPELYLAMQEYNLNLYENGQEDFKDAWSYVPASFELKEWGLEENMVGYLDIPRLDVNLPLYLGASKENMKKGAVHLTQTSLPVGGKNTNCVIAAHRGFSGAAMFRDIEDMQIGDEVSITNPWEKLIYHVVETKVIRPNQVKEVLIQPGRDLVTLITCHPYRHNYQRYVVYCEQVSE